MRKSFKKYLAVLMAAALCLTAMVGMVAQAEGEEVYGQVTDLAEVKDGGEYVVVALYEGKYYAMDSIAARAKKIEVKEVTVADGAVTADNLPVWTFGAMGTGVSINDCAGADTGYIKWDTSTDLVKPNKNPEAYEWQVEAAENGLFRIYVTSGEDKVVLGFRHNIEGAALKFGSWPLSSVEGSPNKFVLEIMLFEKGVAASTPTPTPGPSIDDTADINVAPLYAVLVLGVAVVAFASKKRFAK